MLIKSVFWATYCIGCGRMLRDNEHFLCLHCRETLHETNYHQTPQNPLYQLLSSHCKLQAATALFFFEQGNLAQHLIHQLKYYGKEYIGEYIGKWLALRLQQTPAFASCQVVVPVPMHPHKLRKRGYNQVTLFAKTLAKTMGIAYNAQVLIKQTSNTTQTHKFVWKRYNDSNHIFALQQQEQLEGKHLLLVDDVITTGSTIERCYEQLCHIEGVDISVASMACAIL